MAELIFITVYAALAFGVHYILSEAATQIQETEDTPCN